MISMTVNKITHKHKVPYPKLVPWSSLCCFNLDTNPYVYNEPWPPPHYLHKPYVLETEYPYE